MPRRRSDHDKTRVSSIDKRRVTSVPEEAAASAGIETPGLDRTGDPLEVWTRKDASGCASSLRFLLLEFSEPPQCTPSSWAGLYPSGCHRSALDCRPRVPVSRFPLSADNRLTPQSRSRRPASQRTSPGSEPSVARDLPAHHRQGSRRPRPSRGLSPGSLRLLTSCFVLLLARRTTMLSPSTSPSPADARAPLGAGSR